ncbi:MAG: peptide chain release factor-like protein [Verrucomicrobiota bacterium]
MTSPFPAQLIQRMLALGIHEEDLEERFDRASGPGGQNVNKVATSVFLRHYPTNETVQCDVSRSQASNRVLARERLCERLERKQHSETLLKAQRRRKKRLQTQGRPWKVKEEILKSKRHRSETKKNRRVRKEDY